MKEIENQTEINKENQYQITVHQTLETTNVIIRQIIWNIIGVLSLIASLIGIFYTEVYENIMSDEIMPGIISQDVITMLVSIVLLILCNFHKHAKLKSELVIMGINWYLFYAYGIYVIERAYNILYLVYMAILLLTFYSCIGYMVSFHEKSFSEIKINKIVFWCSIIFSLFVPLLFYPLWISQLIPLMQSGIKIEYLYSIYIIDLCFIFPAYIIFSIKAIKMQARGILAIPYLLLFGFLLLLPVGIGELFRPLYGDPLNIQDMLFYLSLAVGFFLLALLYLLSLKIKQQREKPH